jgi:hypothetical protein
MILFRIIDPQPASSAPGAAQSLVGTWPGRDTPALLALAQVA